MVTVPPIPRDNITTRNSRTLITRDQSERPKAKNMRRLNKAIKETGHNTPSHLAYQEFGEVKTDPRDMFVETLGTSLPRVVGYIVIYQLCSVRLPKLKLTFK